MSNFHTLFAELPSGVDFNCNAEADVSKEHMIAVKRIISSVIQDDALINANFGKSLGDFKEIKSDEPLADSFKVLKTCVDQKNQASTVYKLAFLAAVISKKTLASTRKVMEKITDLCALTGFERGVIVDSILHLNKDYQCNAGSIEAPEKIAITALCCLLLRLDGATHILETEALRVATATLRTGAIPPASLMAAMGKKPTDLFNGLSANAKFWAYLQLLRIGCADTVLRPREKEFLLSLRRQETNAPHLDEALAQVAERVIFIETGLAINDRLV